MTKRSCGPCWSWCASCTRKTPLGRTARLKSRLKLPGCPESVAHREPSGGDGSSVTLLVTHIAIERRIRHAWEINLNQREEAW